MSDEPLESDKPSAPPALPPGGAPAPPAFVRLPKSPGLAAFLSLFPGLGQVYNGRIARAFVFFFAWVGSIYLASTGHEFPFAFLIPFVFFYGIIDAWKGASAINTRFLGGQTENEEETVDSPLWGLSLVVIGLLVLLNNLGWLDLERLARFWPLVLIAVGVYFIRSSLRSRRGAASLDEPPRL
jgi:hypothetical protein